MNEVCRGEGGSRIAIRPSGTEPYGGTGRYIITPAIFDILAHTLPGKGNEVQLTDALQVLVHRQPFYAVLRHGRSHQERPRARKGRAEEVRGVWLEKTDCISQAALQLL